MLRVKFVKTAPIGAPFSKYMAIISRECMGDSHFYFDLFIACLKYWISPYVVSCQFLSEQFVRSFRPVQRNQVYVHIVKFKLENLQIQANPHVQ